MAEQSINIKTITAAKFREDTHGGRFLTPRLKLVLSYTKGGVSCLTGQTYARGYELAVRHDRISEDGFQSMIIDGKGNPRAAIEPAARFSSRVLSRIADEVMKGKHNELIERLYAKARSDRAEHAWPESILPLVEDANATSKPPLLSSIIAAVEKASA